MNRRSFFKSLGVLAASIALPVDAITKALPAGYAISPIKWTKEYDLYRDAWVFRASVFVGRKVDENTKTITLENPVQWHVYVMSATETLDENGKEAALLVLLNSAEQCRRELNA